MLVDTGAGLTKLILRQILFSDYALLVTNPEARAIIDCYKLIKFLTVENPKFKKIDICVNRVRDYLLKKTYPKKWNLFSKRYSFRILAIFAYPVHFLNHEKGLESIRPPGARSPS
ncbi:MAG TPA: hypothetical protein VLM75_13000 [Spirochaetota bacterium]|nr:hypothetical protein [Spirochaetota bacterium]